MNLCRKWVSEKYLSYQHDFTVMHCGGMCLSPINPCFQTIIFGFVLPYAELTDTLDTPYLLDAPLFLPFTTLLPTGGFAMHAEP